MKKAMCILLAVLMVFSCLPVLAEGQNTGEEESAFLQVPGTEPVPVYEKTTDTEKSGSLEPGQLCGLLQEVTESGTNWYLVIYMDRAVKEEKKAAIGYVKADQLKRLTQAEFQALIADPDTLNEVLSLLEASEEYLSGSADETSQSSAAGQGGSSGKNALPATIEEFRDFYKNTMNTLKDVFSKDLTAGLDNAMDQVKDLGKKAVDAGADIIESVADGAAKLANEVKDNVIPEISDALSDGFEKAKDFVEEALPEAKEKVTDAVDSIKDALPEDLNDALKDIRDNIGSMRDSLKDAIPDLKEKAIDLYDQFSDNTGDRIINASETLEGLIEKVSSMSLVFDALPTVVSTIGETVKEDGIIEGANQAISTVNAIINLINIMND